jgi:hypothetical protein
MLETMRAIFGGIGAATKLVSEARSHLERQQQLDGAFFDRCIEPLFESSAGVVRDYIDVLEGLYMALSGPTWASDIAELRELREARARQRGELRAEVAELQLLLPDGCDPDLVEFLEALERSLNPQPAVELGSFSRVVLDLMDVLVAGDFVIAGPYDGADHPVERRNPRHVYNWGVPAMWEEASAMEAKGRVKRLLATTMMAVGYVDLQWEVAVRSITRLRARRHRTGTLLRDPAR